MRNQKATIALVLILLSLALLAISAWFPLPYGSLGTTDFIQYWRSWNILRDGGNPYDPALATAYQAARVQGTTALVMSWNPPWTFLLLAPVTSPSFETAAMLWMLVQFVLLGVIAVVVPLGLEERSPSVIVRAITAILFFPVLNALYYGQLSVLLATSVALFLFFQQRGAFFLAGMSLLPLSAKPHLLFLFVVPGIQWLFQLPREQALRFLAGALGSFLAVVLFTCAFSPTAISDWIAALTLYSSAPPIEGSTPFPLWQTTTLATWVRIALTSEGAPSWPLKLVPAASLIVTILYFSISRRHVVWKEVTPPLLCLTLLTSNYGWAYDQSVLVVTQMAIVCGALGLKRRAQRIGVLSLAFGIQALAISLSSLPQHYFVWLPIVLLLLLLTQRKLASLHRSFDGV